MRLKVISLIVLCLVCVISSEAQNKIQIIESDIEATFINNKLETDLSITSSKTVDSAKVLLRILDEDNTVLAENVSKQNIKKGKQTFEKSLEFTKLQTDTEDLLWYRLSYEVSSVNSELFTKGIVSLSEIMPEIFNLKVIASKEVYAGMKYRVHILTLHPITKKPVKNVAVTGFLEIDLDTDETEDELKIEAKGESNGEGFASLDFEIPVDTKILDDGELKVKATKNGIVREAEEDLDVSNKSFVYLHTDKPIYQPDQKLFVRGLYLNPEKKPIADAEFEIRVLDADEETVYKESVKTSRFGVANLEWKIPESIKLGEYEVKIEDSDYRNIGSIKFKITRYELPNFSVKAKPDRSFYTPDIEKAEIKVSAEYLFGKPVTKGSVRIVLEEDLDEEVDELEKQAEKLDKDGTFSAEFDLSEFHKKLENIGYKYFKDIKFTAYFTDSTTKRTEQKRFDVRITKEPIHIRFIRYYDDANPALPYQFYVSTFSADGTPLKAEIGIEGHYKNVKPTTNIVNTKTNSYGVSKIEIDIPQKPFEDVKDEFIIKITAKDKDGNVGTFIDNVYVNEKKKQIRIYSDKAIYKPNETINAEVFSTAKNDSVVVDVVNESGVIYSKIVKIKNGKANIRIGYRPDFEGELTLSAYSLNSENYYDISHYSKAIIFPKASKLDFNIKSLKTVYRPNEEATINFKVRDDNGKAMETALGIVVLDKAIEERARTEGLPDNYGLIRKLLGVADSFGDLTRRDLNNLDLDKRISRDLQLAAEFLLVNRSFKPNFFDSKAYQRDFRYHYRDYFKKAIKPLENVLEKHYEKTDEYPKNLDSLKEILKRNNLAYESLVDAWGQPYKYEFDFSRRKLKLTISTASGDKEFSTDDDFIVKTLEFEAFRKLNNELTVILNNHTSKAKKSPQTAEELTQVWKNGGVDIESIKDNSGQQLYIETYEYSRNITKTVFETIGKLDDENQQVQRTRPVRQEIVIFNLRSKGLDGVKNNKDDFNVGTFLGVVLEETISDGDEIKSKISKRRTSDASGAVSGTISDPSGAVIPGANVTIENQNTKEEFNATTNDAGYFLIAGLPSGKYDVRAVSLGFQTIFIKNVIVSSMNLVELNLILYVAHVSAMVTVEAGVELINTSNANVSNTVTESSIDSIASIVGSGGNKSTPRVREYFPETLVWKPEIVTDKNGRAKIKFKLADSLTTWKFYAIGSTQDGKIEMAEKELQTFQPFFAELDPPKILTEGDEISLPVPVRNYTGKRQNVAVEMAENNWSSLLNGSVQAIKIDADSTENAIFRFRATKPIKDGKQKVTAIAKKEGDSIEKSVIVNPNGKEIVNPQTKFFEKQTTFDVDFPAESFPSTKKVEIKIYPNMLSHVAESVEGLLKRPYGCGEQTTSSTYPNLMILRFAKSKNYEISNSLRRKAEINLQDGYDRLLNYQTDSGFGYWSGNDPDIALTAYVLQFFNDAKEFIDVDENAVNKAERWLLKQQLADGSWDGKYKGKDLVTSYVARTLSLTKGKDKFKQESLQKALSYLEDQLSESNDSYILANFALASIESENLKTAKKVIEVLTGNKNLTSKRTAFYGSGKTAEIETKALITQAFLKYQRADKNLDTEQNVARNLQFLLDNKDRFGVWFSTQTTVNVLNTLILFQQMQQQMNEGVKKTADILINGVRIKQLEIDNNTLNNPFVIKVSDQLNQQNRIDIKGFDSLAMAQIVATHYVNWNQTEMDSRYFDFTVNYSKTNTEIGEVISCNVRINSKQARYGMILAEIGTPPGADVDRASLESLVNSKQISRYDVLPDRVTIYAWANVDANEFNFTFRTRYGINANTPASIVYDYYNEEAKAVIPPTKFEVK